MLTTYAELDVLARRKGHKMGKNDLWIAACAVAADATVLTCDGDFDVLHDAGAIRRLKIPGSDTATPAEP